MLGKNDLFEALIRVGNAPDKVWEIMEKLHMQQPEGIMLYEEAEICTKSGRAFTVVFPLYEYRFCCPVHPPHDYDIHDPGDIGYCRHIQWRAEQTNNLNFQRIEEQEIMGSWRVRKNWHKFGGVIPPGGYVR